jgi:hypothetical protein
MTQHRFLVRWSFAIQGSIMKVVKEYFPQELHRWPVRNFNSEGYIWAVTYLIIILRDSISTIPTMHDLDTANEVDFPKGKPSLENILEWQVAARKKYNVTSKDAVMIIPMIGDGPTVTVDWEKWDDKDKQLWHWQIEYNVQNHFYLLKGFDRLDNFFLPPGYIFLADECSRFFQDHPRFEQNVFIMTRFVPGNRLLEQLDAELRKVLREHGLNPLRADDKMYMRDRNLWNNVCVYMLSCKTGISILEDRVSDEFNPNVALEYGFMRALNKPVLLLADIGFRNLRADIIGTLREQFDITDIAGTIRSPVEKWLREIEKIS